MTETYPGQWEKSMEIGPEVHVRFRPVKPTDETMMHDFFYSLSDRSIYSRFFSHLKSFPTSFLRRFVNIDYREDMTVVGLVHEGKDESIIAAGHYVLNNATNMGEVALIVRDDWQNRGIGTFLLDYLIKIAKDGGLAGFTAEVLKENAQMLKLFRKVGFSVSAGHGRSSCTAELKFAEVTEKGDISNS